MIRGAERLFKLYDRCAKVIEADQTEMLYIGGERGLTRFHKNYIHQSSSVVRTHAQFRVVWNGKIGTYATERMDDDGLRTALRKALEIAKVQERDKEFRSLPRGREIIDTRWYDEETAAASPRWRAGIVAKIVRRAEKHGAEVAGALTTGYESIVVCNSEGIRSYQMESVCELNLVALRGVHTSYAFWIGTKVGDLPHERLAKKAIERTLITQEPIALAPGRYTVILEPYAVGTMIGYLGYVGFGAKAYQEKRSFMSRLKGRKVASEQIRLWDDGSDARGLPRAFDYEGVKKHKVTLLDRGVAKSVVYDSRTAAKEKGARNTGHALPAPNSYGPLPTNLVMGAGKSSVGEMIQSIERGIYVTRFHYVNIVEPLKTIITGMTRDGTFLIEGGKVKGPVKNLRFTQNVLEALKSTLAVSRETQVVDGLLGPSVMAALIVQEFNFTGMSEIS